MPDLRRLAPRRSRGMGSGLHRPARRQGRGAPRHRQVIAMPETKVHPAAEAFPEMSASELQELADDIKSRGLMHPIMRTDDDTVLDGRNRLKACEIASVKPRFEVYKGVDP